MAIAYLDCAAGISGDMCLGAIVDAGVSLKKLGDRLKSLPVRGYRLESARVTRSSIASTKVDVILKPDAGVPGAGSRKWKDIDDIIGKSGLSPHIKERARKIFRRLFEAEGKIHGKAYNKTHLHELGAVDCLVDIVGTLIGLDILGVDKLYASAVNLGSGSVKTGHGKLPVPAPATAEILKGIPVYSSDIPFELTTPTGAAILSGLADGFVNLPLMKIDRIGYGAGRKDFTDLPNVLRILVGETAVKNQEKHSGLSPSSRHLTLIETNIDDMNPQLYGYVMERLFKAGALDVYLTQIIMKKGRPGVLITALCPPDRKTAIMDILFRETTTLGIRFYETSRTALEREIKEIRTKWGKIRIKTAMAGNDTMKRSPEYEDCRSISVKHKLPLIEVMRQADEFQK